MEFSRKTDNKFEKGLSIGVALFGLSLFAYSIIAELSFGWVALGCIIGIYLLYRGIAKHKSQSKEIKALAFDPDGNLKLTFFNGERLSLDKQQLGYSMLVKKYYYPVRALKINSLKPLAFGMKRSRGIGVLKVKHWEKELQQLANYLIKNDYEKRSWKIGWGMSELLLLTGMLLGIIEDYAEGTLGSQDILHLSSGFVDAGELSSDLKDEINTQNQENEAAYRNRTKKKNG